MDALLTWNGTSADLGIVNGDLAMDTGLFTAVVISLCSDGRAAFADELPPGVSERRGWWAGDADFGSKLWLLVREKTTQQTAFRARQYAENALRWMVEDGLAESVTVESEILNPEAIAVAVEIRRGGNKKFDYLWRGMENNDLNTYSTRIKIPLGGGL